MPLAEAPAWLLALCRKPKLSEQARATGPRIDTGHATAWAQAALRDELRDVLAAPEGRRNEALNVAAFNLGQVVGGGALAEADVRARLMGAGLAAGLEAAETEATVASGLTAGMAKPRAAPEQRSSREQCFRSAEEAGEGPALPDDGEIELTEDGVARAFTARFKGRLRFDHEAGAWYEWTGEHWRRDGTGLAFQFAREVARSLSQDGTERDRTTARKKGFAAGVEAFARVDRNHAVTQEAWDRDPFLLGVPGGLVDLRTAQLRTADPASGITKRAAVTPAAKADCPLWLAFLHEATGGDLEVIAFLRRWLGYCLTGDTREHALIFVYGPGGNGKSVLLNTVTRLMGDYATTAAMDTFTTSKGDKHPTELALLRGARLVTASETEEGRAWAEARIKQMTGGDPITARFMRQDFFTYRPQFKLTIVGNHAPALANVDDAARRRFNILPFTRKPANPDRALEAKLEAEWPAILRWMVEGAVEWLRDGLRQPESIRAATADYFSEQDMVARWIEERCTLTPANPGHYETAAELFASWSEFAKAAGEPAGTQKAFAPKLRRHGLRDGFRWAQGRSVRAWEGIEILRNRGSRDD